MTIALSIQQINSEAHALLRNNPSINKIKRELKENYERVFVKEENDIEIQFTIPQELTTITMPTFSRFILKPQIDKLSNLITKHIGDNALINSKMPNLVLKYNLNQVIFYGIALFCETNKSGDDITFAFTVRLYHG